MHVYCKVEFKKLVTLHHVNTCHAQFPRPALQYSVKDALSVPLQSIFVGHLPADGPPCEGALHIWVQQVNVHQTRCTPWRGAAEVGKAVSPATAASLAAAPAPSLAVAPAPGVA